MRFKSRVQQSLWHHYLLCFDISAFRTIDRRAEVLFISLRGGSGVARALEHAASICFRRERNGATHTRIGSVYEPPMYDVGDR
jgi:hypothetical protein